MMKKKILFGTTNPSKLNRIRNIVRELPLKIISLKDLDIEIEADEDGNDVHENAYQKALTYYKESKIPTVSIDSGLYIDKFSEDKQPGIFVRRINGKKATDEEMFEYYRDELIKVGGKSEGKWISSITFVLDEDRTIKHEVIEERLFIDRPSPIKKKGLPLSSLAIDKTFNKYVSEITEEERTKLQEKTDKEIFNMFKKVSEEI
ncbi:non-canonical purine NTP pyrophosphatase [Sporosalibacterium faouarense]|uniref:non-canonical purine NTP pyrophosphatase n=1 Tax=Sporosalibacterium faouarense TaxID=516123 RepID=UPI00192AE865|nr:non-canonical purine NTP pyrophosphatase [Sporosalibacterium faouarense]